MHQNLLNTEFASGEYRNAWDKNMPVFGVMNALTKVLHKSFCCTYACLSSDPIALFGLIVADTSISEAISEQKKVVFMGLKI